MTRLRLRNQWLTGTTRRTPLEVVSHFSAVQSQEFGPATWAIGLRARGLTQADVIRAYDAGEIVRIHVLRPTWHFVSPSDLRWMLALTAPRLRASVRGRFVQLGLSGDEVTRSLKTIERALSEGTPLTRAELAERLRREGLRAEGQQPYHLTFQAELAQIVCSGPMRGMQFTYDLLDRRVPPASPIDRDEALALLARRYFTSHGPATLRDFAWWSGLTVGDGRRATAILGAGLEEVEIDGTAYHLVPSRVPPAPRAPVAHLIPCFDELTVAYVDRRAVAGPPAPRGESPGDMLVDLIVVNGVRVGTWRRPSRTRTVPEIVLTRKLTHAERAAVEKAVERYRAFVAG